MDRAAAGSAEDPLDCAASPGVALSVESAAAVLACALVFDSGVVAFASASAGFDSPEPSLAGAPSDLASAELLPSPATGSFSSRTTMPASEAGACVSDGVAAVALAFSLPLACSLALAF